ncbi:hypothetical protein, partial [Thiolapillus sp.]|uniref:hypothetical protein n=1 Tax=Thiolapillus sp. TaxID=2017437 RepID=UPI003AF82FF1
TDFPDPGGPSKIILMPRLSLLFNANPHTLDSGCIPQIDQIYPDLHFSFIIGRITRTTEKIAT